MKSYPPIWVKDDHGHWTDKLKFDSVIINVLNNDSDSNGEPLWVISVGRL